MEQLCNRPGCGRSPSDHAGWELGHLMTTEEQPPAADATVARLGADDPLTPPFIVRVERPRPAVQDNEGPYRPDPLISYSAWNDYPVPSVNFPRAVAEYQAVITRVAHTYNGPMTVYVWPSRGDAEHYRAPVPAGAYMLELGPAS